MNDIFDIVNQNEYFLFKRLINLQPYEIYSTFESMYMYVHINYEKQLNRKKMYTDHGGTNICLE